MYKSFGIAGFGIAVFNEEKFLMFGNAFDVGAKAFELFVFLLEYLVNTFHA